MQHIERDTGYYVIVQEEGGQPEPALWFDGAWSLIGSIEALDDDEVHEIVRPLGIRRSVQAID